MAALRQGVEDEIAEAIRLAGEDEVASPDDLIPSVYAPHAEYPNPPEPGEREIDFITAIREALTHELGSDPTTFIMGEDIGKVGGLFRATEGLWRSSAASASETRR